PEGKFIGGEDVLGVAGAIRAHEDTLLPKGIADFLAGDARDACRDAKLGGCGHLGLDAARIAHYVHQAVGRRVLSKVVARQPPSYDLGPGKGLHDLPDYPLLATR